MEFDKGCAYDSKLDLFKTCCNKGHHFLKQVSSVKIKSSEFGSAFLLRCTKSATHNLVFLGMNFCLLFLIFLLGKVAVAQKTNSESQKGQHSTFTDTYQSIIAFVQSCEDPGTHTKWLREGRFPWWLSISYSSYRETEVLRKVYLCFKSTEGLNEVGGPAYMKNRCGTSLLPLTDSVIETQQVCKAFWVL